MKFQMYVEIGEADISPGSINEKLFAQLGYVLARAGLRYRHPVILHDPECTEAITKDDVIRRLDKAIGHYRAELYKDSESDATRVAEKEASSWRRVLESLDYPDDPENPIDPLTAVLRRT